MIGRKPNHATHTQSVEFDWVSDLDSTFDLADAAESTAITEESIDSINLESFGSGSGLMDLTRESDDTSLGQTLPLEQNPPRQQRSVTLKNPASSEQSKSSDRWICSLAFCMPKKNREPWLGDILADRHEMRQSGYSSRSINLLTIVQLLNATWSGRKTLLITILGSTTTIALVALKALRGS